MTDEKIGYKVGSMKGAFWWIDRWRKSTAYTDMNAEARGVYRELIDELWLRDGFIPDNEQTFINLAGGPDVWKRVKKIVLSHFILTPNGYRNETHDEVSAKSKALKDRQSDKGKKSADARKGPTGKQPEPQPEGNQETAELQPSVLRSPFSGNGSPEIDTPTTERARELYKVPGTTTALSVEECSKIDALDGNLAFEERRFTSLATPLRDSIQSVLDSLPRPASRSPFSASRWLATGLTGISRSENALTALRLTNDALEARQRAQGQPYLTENTKKSLEAIARVTGAKNDTRASTDWARALKGSVPEHEV